jgi:predicted SprT family Zn-dependent metalloprotease
MSNLKAVEKLANELLSKKFSLIDRNGNIRHISAKGIGYTFKFDHAKRRFGCCNYGTKTISLSKHLCEANLNQLNGKITDTILHELAHAFCVEIFGIRDGRGHGYKWKTIAKQIGSDGKRCYSYSDFGGINKPESKYTHICPTCSKESPVHRKPKRSYACGDCCTNGYDPQHKLILRQNY